MLGFPGIGFEEDVVAAVWGMVEVCSLSRSMDTRVQGLSRWVMIR